MLTSDEPISAAGPPASHPTAFHRLASYGSVAYAERPRPEASLLGVSDTMQHLRMQVRLLGPHFRVVLLQGERGTGKQLVASVLHASSTHADGPFVVFECGEPDATCNALHHAFTAAHRGTIYLRRVDAMPQNSQAMLLSLLQSRQRLLPHPIVVRGLEARILASSSEDLRALAATGDFMQELLRRLGSVTLSLPPLRERLDDLPLLARHFLAQAGQDRDPDPEAWKRRLPPSAALHHWPENLSELRRWMLRTNDADIAGVAAPTLESAGAPEPELEREAGNARLQNRLQDRLQDIVEQHVLQVLRDCSGNKVRAAEVLGISRSTLYRMLESGFSDDKLVRTR